jgi:hypothetical protein
LLPAISWGLGLVFLFAAIRPVFAHDVDQSYLFLTVENQKIGGRVEVTTRDLNQALNLGWPEDGSLTLEQIQQADSILVEYVTDRLALTVDGIPTSMDVVGYDYQTISIGQFVHIELQFTPVVNQPRMLEVTNGLVFDVDPKHRSLLVVENHWRAGTLSNEMVISLVFGPDDRTQSLDVSEGSVLRGLWGFIESGMHHIWIGLDHILFLLALLLPSVMVRSQTGWSGAPDLKFALWRVVKIVTVFTIAHSITLSVAALGVVSIGSRVVESIIAISIGIAALHILVPTIKSHAVWVVLAFGLFHGFGFASVLGELAIPEEYLIWSLLGFNIGVEIGQLAIVIGLVPILFLIRDSVVYARFMLPWGAVGLLFVSLYWFTERALDVDFALRRTLRELAGL